MQIYGNLTTRHRWENGGRDGMNGEKTEEARNKTGVFNYREKQKNV